MSFFFCICMIFLLYYFYFLLTCFFYLLYYCFWFLFSFFFIIVPYFSSFVFLILSSIFFIIVSYFSFLPSIFIFFYFLFTLFSFTLLFIYFFCPFHKRSKRIRDRMWLVDRDLFNGKNCLSQISLLREPGVSEFKGLTYVLLLFICLWDSQDCC